MALSRVTTWVAGQVLKAADLNGEFNNILNNPITLISPTTGVINFNGQAHTNLVPGAIAATSAGSTGQVLVNSAAGTGLYASLVGSRVRNLVGTLTSQNGTFTADQYVLQSTFGTGGFVLNSTASFTVSIGTAGPAVNGRDVAAAFASTEVHWYAITSGPNSTTPAGVVSSQAPPTGPAMPTSYSLWAYLGGSPYTSATTTVLQDHRFRGNRAFYDTPPVVLNAGAATVETAVTLSSVMPANALGYEVSQQLGTVSSAAATFFNVQPIIRVVSGSNYFSPSFIAASAGGFSLSHPLPDISIPNVSRQFFYLLVLNTATSATLTTNLIGYTMPNGD